MLVQTTKLVTWWSGTHRASTFVVLVSISKKKFCLLKIFRVNLLYDMPSALFTFLVDYTSSLFSVASDFKIRFNIYFPRLKTLPWIPCYPSVEEKFGCVVTFGIVFRSFPLITLSQRLISDKKYYLNPVHNVSSEKSTQIN